MNRLSTAKRVAVISALVEGCSVRSTSRLTGVAKGTILRLLASVGDACARYQDDAIRNVPASAASRLMKSGRSSAASKRTSRQRLPRSGSLATRGRSSAIEAQTKLVLSWLVGLRDAGCATEFLQDVADASRIAFN